MAREDALQAGELYGWRPMGCSVATATLWALKPLAWAMAMGATAVACWSRHDQGVLGGEYSGCLSCELLVHPERDTPRGSFGRPRVPWSKPRWSAVA
jgi:hypothetical protein